MASAILRFISSFMAISDASFSSFRSLIIFWSSSADKIMVCFSFLFVRRLFCRRLCRVLGGVP
jgi:hypothetical protein